MMCMISLFQTNPKTQSSAKSMSSLHGLHLIKAVWLHRALQNKVSLEMRTNQDILLNKKLICEQRNFVQSNQILGCKDKSAMSTGKSLKLVLK